MILVDGDQPVDVPRNELVKDRQSSRVVDKFGVIKNNGATKLIRR